MEYGGDIMIFLDDSGTKKPVAYSTSAKLTVNRNTREKTSKDSGVWSEFAHGKMNWTASTDGLVAFTTSGDTLTIGDLYTAFKTESVISIAFAKKTGTSPSWTIDNGTDYFSGNAIITSLDINAPDEENATYSISLQGTGELTFS